MSSRRGWWVSGVVRLKCDGAELRAASRVSLGWVRVRGATWQGVNDHPANHSTCNINPSISMLANHIHESPIQNKRHIQIVKP